MGKMKKGQIQQQEELLSALEDFTSKENWDKFFSIRGTDVPFEWYAEWPQLRDLLLSHLSPTPENVAVNGGTSAEERATASTVQILVPGCGNSQLSEQLYDAGFHCITNIDFSKVVIGEMLRRNVRSRPDMRWRVMDMTSMQFAEETFDAILDKGGLDALMEPKLGPTLGNQYVSEVKRVLKRGGKFVCLTLGESHVLGILLPKLRYGWKLSIDVLPQKSSKGSSLRTFMVVAEKASPTYLHAVSSSFDHSTLECGGGQARGIFEVLENENRIRIGCLDGADTLHSLEDLKLGSKGDLSELSPGRRIELTLGEPGQSLFCYRSVLLDAQPDSGEFLYHCGVFLVPKTRAHEWLFYSEEGQWMVVESSKSARLIMVFLDASHTGVSSDDIQKDLSPLVRQLAPAKVVDGAQIPFMAASDGIKQRKNVHQVMSPLTGPIIVDDVVYEKVDSELAHLSLSKDLVFRRLTFERSEGLIQSEALLTTEGSQKTIGEKGPKKTHSSSKSKKRGSHKSSDSHVSLVDDASLKVDHSYLASAYHSGIISGFMLISSYLERVASAGRAVKAVIIGLGAGLLPMFLYECVPFLNIEVVELDPVVVDLARDYFGFREDERLKVRVADGIKFVGDVANSKAADIVPPSDENKVSVCTKLPSAGGNSVELKTKSEGNDTLDILIVDVDSPDSSSGMTCPAADFIEESFLITVKNSLSKEGLFVINLVSRSSAIKEMVISRMKMVFSNLFSLQLEEDVNEVIFALRSEVSMDIQSPEASNQLEKLLKMKQPEMGRSIFNSIKKIKPLNSKN